jgi:hypothetical protein
MNLVGHERETAVVSMLVVSQSGTGRLTRFIESLVRKVCQHRNKERVPTETHNVPVGSNTSQKEVN